MLADLMGKSRTTITEHISNLLKSGEISNEENMINSNNVGISDIISKHPKCVILYGAKVFTLFAFKVNSPSVLFIKDTIVKLVNDALVSKEHTDELSLEFMKLRHDSTYQTKFLNDYIA